MQTASQGANVQPLQVVDLVASANGQPLANLTLQVVNAVSGKPLDIISTGSASIISTGSASIISTGSASIISTGSASFGAPRFFLADTGTSDATVQVAGDSQTDAQGHARLYLGTLPANTVLRLIGSSAGQAVQALLQPASAAQPWRVLDTAGSAQPLDPATSVRAVLAASLFASTKGLRADVRSQLATKTLANLQALSAAIDATLLANPALAQAIITTSAGSPLVPNLQAVDTFLRTANLTAAITAVAQTLSDDVTAAAKDPVNLAPASEPADVAGPGDPTANQTTPTIPGTNLSAAPVLNAPPAPPPLTPPATTTTTAASSSSNSGGDGALPIALPSTDPVLGIQLGYRAEATP